jgi:DNA-binding transcriptional LysR family regulator
MIDLVRLRALRAVAASGTVTAAATMLYCTPSAVSQHLAKLERETGARLVEKDGRRLRLTEAGRVLALHAGRVLAAVEEAEAALAALDARVCGRLVIAAFPTACRGLLPHTLARLTADHPQLEPALLEADPRVGLDLVARGEVDLVLIDDWPEVAVVFPPGVTHTELGADIADLVVPADHPLAADTTPVRLTDIADQRWIASTPGSICHEWLTRVLPGVRPDFLVAEFETQLTLIAAGLCIGLIPRLARPDVPPGVAIRAVTPTPSRQVTIAWRQAAAARPAIAATIAALRDSWQTTTATPTTRRSQWGAH